MSPELRRVNPGVWRACAGLAAQIPIINSRVYYFPQGHVEHSNTTSLNHLSHLVQSRPFIPCRVSAVDLLADDVTDEVFAKVLLVPIESLNYFNEGRTVISGFDDGDDVDKVTAFTKVLTPSDANNGGGFSVPRICAETIFPPLNFNVDRPVQTLLITDVHGVVWDFRHIFRGTPKRHLLTTGWSTFVNNMKLIAGDSVVFMRNLKGELFVGIRRVKRSCGVVGYAQWRERIGGDGDEGGGGWGGGSGRVKVEEVGKAIELAVKGLPFEVVYYPKAGLSDFVVKAEVVEAGMNVLWTAGMRVKMAVETDDSSRMTWFHGTVFSVFGPGNGPWRVSPWRSLQVTWDEPEILHHAKRVSPWQVEFVEPPPSLRSAFPLTKRFKVSQGTFLAGGGREVVYPVTGFNNSTMRHLNSALLNYKSFPAGMQGARQSSFQTSSLLNLLNENTPKICSNGFQDVNVTPKLKSMSTELTIGSSNSSNLSLSSQSSGQSSAAEYARDRNSGLMKASVNSFKLFGKIIRMGPVNDSPLYDTDSTNDEVIKGYDETGSLSNPHDPTGLVDSLDVQCRRTSVLKVSSL